MASARSNLSPLIVYQLTTPGTQKIAAEPAR